MNPAHIDGLEKVMGVPLTPPGVENVPLTGDTVRGFVGTSVLRLIQKRFPKSVTPDGIELSEDQAAHLSELGGVRRLAAELQAANDTLVKWHWPPAMPADADDAVSPRAIVQARVMKRLVGHAQGAPVRVRHPDSPYREGMLTVTPPGSGKTLLKALVANYSGIGLPVSKSDPSIRKGVAIMDSKLLIAQNLDPDETLQRFLNVGGRDIRVGGYYMDRRDGHDEYDLLLTTPESYEKGVQAGAINTKTTLRYLLDEAHRTAMAPTMQQHLTRFGTGLYMFTATPAIAGGRRDLRHQYPHSQFGSLREFVQDGILSPIQLFTYRAGPEPGSAEKIAISQAVDYVRSGRKTLVVCQPGGELKQARDITARINHLYREGRLMPHARFTKADPEEIACTLGSSYEIPTQKNIELLRRGERLIACTVATGNAGLNIPDLDGLVVIGPQGALWQLEQWIGRIERPSGQIALASEILPPDIIPGRPQVSIFNAYGIYDEPIKQGYYIGPISKRERQLEQAKELETQREDAKRGLPMAPEIALGTIATAGLEPGAENLSDYDKTDYAPRAPRGLYEPPEDLRVSLERAIPVREAIIAPADLAKRPPADYKPLDVVLPENVPEKWLFNILSKLKDPDIRYVGTYEPDIHGNMQYVRYYSPAAHQYFIDHPPQQAVSESEFKDEDIAEMLGVSRSRVRNIIEKIGHLPLPRITKYHRNPRYYGVETLQAVTAEVERTPPADETDTPAVELGEELGGDFMNATAARFGIVSLEKRRHPIWGQVGYCHHFTETEATFLREIHASLGDADPKYHITFQEMASIARTSPNLVRNQLKAIPPELKPRSEWLRTERGVMGEFFERTWGEAFAEYISPEKVLPWETTQAVVAKYFGISKAVVGIKYTGRHNKVKIPLHRVAGKTVIYPLSAIIDFMTAGYKPAEGMPLLTPELAALKPEDAADQERVAYSRQFQQHFLPAEHITAPDEIEYYQRRREQPLEYPNPDNFPEIRAKRLDSEGLARRVAARREHTAAENDVQITRRLGDKATQPPKAAETTKRDTPAPKIKRFAPLDEQPDGQVNVASYLTAQGAPCAAHLIPMVARRHRIARDRLTATADGQWWSTTSDAETIALAVMEFAKAGQDMVSGQQLAEKYSTTKVKLNEGDIHKVAARVLSGESRSMADVVKPLRREAADGSAGELCNHYVSKFAEKIEEQLRILGEKDMLHAIRRW